MGVDPLWWTDSSIWSLLLPRASGDAAFRINVLSVTVTGGLALAILFSSPRNDFQTYTGDLECSFRKLHSSSWFVYGVPAHLAPREWPLLIFVTHNPQYSIYPFFYYWTQSKEIYVYSEEGQEASLWGLVCIDPSRPSPERLRSQAPGS